MSAKILAALLPDIPDMDTLVRRAYQGKFETEDLTPTVSVGGYSVLELFRGPTSAFKDVALSMLPQLLTAAKAVKGMEKDILILTATSGDTGKAALEGFHDVPARASSSFTRTEACPPCSRCRWPRRRARTCAYAPCAATSTTRRPA